jgi:hypothetical protein
MLVDAPHTLVVVAIGPDQLGAVGRVAACGATTPQRCALGKAPAVSKKCLLQDDAMLGLGRAATRRRPLLEAADQVVIDVAHQQLAHLTTPVGQQGHRTSVLP